MAKVSFVQAARALEVDRGTLTSWRKRGLPTTPGPRGAHLVDVDEARAWAASVGLSGTQGRPLGGSCDLPPADAAPVVQQAAPAGPAGPVVSTEDVERQVRERVAREVAQQVQAQLKSAELRKKTAEAEARELANAGKKGRLVDRADVERQQVGAILTVKRALEVVPAKLAARLVGRTREEIHEELAAEVDSLCRMFAEEFAKL